jgi:hypothetical protein
VTRAATVMVLGIVLLVSGCGVAGPFRGDPVREEWESHGGVADCGSTVVRQGEPLQPSREVRRCFRRALEQGRSVRLSLTYPTTEGDPIRDHLLLTEDGTVRLYEDTTDDAFGSDEWSLLECFEPEWQPDVRCG